MAKGQKCVYCGREVVLTEDHIPPRALWAKPRPKDLVIVPSCSDCNAGASKDDEYFKTMVVLKDGAGLHPEARAITGSVFRALQMPKKAAYRKYILNAVQLQSLRSKGGLYLGRVPTVDIDLARLDRVAARVIRGLYWHHLHDRLPADCLVVAWSESGLVSMDADALEQVSSMVGRLRSGDQHQLGRGVLQYWYATAEVQYASVWLLEFYGDVRFLGLTIPPQQLSMSNTPVQQTSFAGS
ncbi:MAG: hypothetical protein JXA58_07145 [Dehalococcoidia bacterium]|nr:hypothetical protein [Dehalococcoidia bacterium]